jgi:hypothetical protein
MTFAARQIQESCCRYEAKLKHSLDSSLEQLVPTSEHIGKFEGLNTEMTMLTISFGFRVFNDIKQKD